MNAELITVWVFGLLVGAPLTLIFWAHIALAIRDIWRTKKMKDGLYARMRRYARAGNWRRALVLMRCNGLPAMQAAFRTTQIADGRCEMIFRFPSIEAMHEADREWHQFRQSTSA
jgi:hypothetical protein